jgi:FkbM family methyltransferase
MRLWRSIVRPYVKPFVYKYRSALLYRAASFYVNAVDNDHDNDWKTNGEAAFARERLRGARVAFDIGAAIGGWTEVALSADPSVVVHCFEPTSRRFAKLSSRGVGERAVLNNFAMGDTVSSAEIFYDASGGSNSLFPQRYGGETYASENVERVQISTIDRYCAEHGIEYVDFIKMDIEGYEPAAIRGAKDMMRAGKIGVIQFEYSYVFLDAGTSLLQLMKVVNEINPDYEFHKIYPDGVRPVRTYRHTLDNFKTQNWALIKRSGA